MHLENCTNQKVKHFKTTFCCTKVLVLLNIKKYTRKHGHPWLNTSTCTCQTHRALRIFKKNNPNIIIEAAKSVSLKAPLHRGLCRPNCPWSPEIKEPKGPSWSHEWMQRNYCRVYKFLEVFFKSWEMFAEGQNIGCIGFFKACTKGGKR